MRNVGASTNGLTWADVYVALAELGREEQLLMSVEMSPGLIGREKLVVVLRGEVEVTDETKKMVKALAHEKSFVMKDFFTDLEKGSLPSFIYGMIVRFSFEIDAWKTQTGF